jgi:hypothetical protein
VASLGLIAAATGAPAAAGLRYRFAFEGGRGGTVWADGGRCRVEIETVKDGVPLYDLVLDDGDRRMYVSTAGKTYWSALEHPEALPTLESNLPFAMLEAEGRKVLEPSVAVTEEDYAEPVAGLPTRKFVIRFRYLLEHQYPTEVVRVTVSATWLLWTTPALEGRPCGIDPGSLPTGIPEIDALLDAELAKIPGFPLQRQLSLTHRIHRGTSVTEIQTLTFDALEAVTMPASLLAVPDGYRHQAPVFAGLAVEKAVVPGAPDGPP